MSNVLFELAFSVTIYKGFVLAASLAVMETYPCVTYENLQYNADI